VLNNITFLYYGLACSCFACTILSTTIIVLPSFDYDNFVLAVKLAIVQIAQGAGHHTTCMVQVKVDEWQSPSHCNTKPPRNVALIEDKLKGRRRLVEFFRLFLACVQGTWEVSSLKEILPP
jgi:hypothetical protein